jgi:hypothetical protein
MLKHISLHIRLCHTGAHLRFWYHGDNDKEDCEGEVLVSQNGELKCLYPLCFRSLEIIFGFEQRILGSKRPSSGLKVAEDEKAGDNKRCF